MKLKEEPIALVKNSLLVPFLDESGAILNYYLAVPLVFTCDFNLLQ
jgi:hypothetical protein